jgi:zinc transport system permease protein
MDEALTIGQFFEAWELFRAPVLAGTAAGALLGWLGVYIVMRRMVFLSAALSQCAGLGVTLAFYAQIHWGMTGLLVSPTVAATGVTLLAALVPSLDRRLPGVSGDSLLGVVFLIGAAGSLALGTRIVQELHDIQAILFGSAVVVLDDQLAMVLWTVGALLLLHLWWLRGFVEVTFDPDGSRVRGLPVRLLEVALFVSLAVGISVCTRVLGALPVFAFSVLPALAALLLSPNVNRALLLAGLFGAAAGFGGYVVAFLYSLPVGASQALLAAALVLAAAVVRVPLRWLGARLRVLRAARLRPA